MYMPSCACTWSYFSSYRSVVLQFLIPSCDWFTYIIPGCFTVCTRTVVPVKWTWRIRVKSTGTWPQWTQQRANCVHVLYIDMYLINSPKKAPPLVRYFNENMHTMHLICILDNWNQFFLRDFKCIVQDNLCYNMYAGTMWHCALVSCTPSLSMGLFFGCTLFRCWVQLCVPFTNSLFRPDGCHFYWDFMDIPLILIYTFRLGNCGRHQNIMPVVRFAWETSISLACCKIGKI